MSLTITQITPSPVASPSPAKRALNITDVKPMLEALVKDLHASELFVDQSDVINHWQSNMERSFLSDLTTPEGLRKASVGICFLLCNVIRPLLFANKQNISMLTRIYPFETTLMQILSITCPDEEFRKKLVESYHMLASARLKEKETIKKVKNAYLSLENDLNQMTDITLENLTKTFEDLKSKLLALNTNRSSSSETAQKQLQHLVAKIATMSARLSASAEENAATGTTLLVYKEDLLKMVRAIKQVVTEV